MSGSAPPDWHLTETFKGLITLAVEVLKALILVNGGAAIAVLTYLSSSHIPGRSPDITGPLRWFSSGVAAAMLAFVTAYATQLLLYNEAIRRRTSGVPEHHHIWGIAVCLVLAVFSVAAFVAGSFSAAFALGALK